MLKLSKVYILFVFLNSCNAQSNVNNCTSAFKIAKNNYSDYFRSKDTVELIKGLANVEKALSCDVTRHAAIDLKISLLSLLKEYRRGYEFIDSLKEDGFLMKYKKNMNYNFFRAMNYKEANDSTNYSIFINRALRDVKSYIKNENNNTSGKFDEDAYYDLIFIKSQMERLEEVSHEIDSLKTKYPSEADFLEAIKSTLENKESEMRSSETTQ